MTKKIYMINADNTARFALGELGGETLFVIGLNPSTATDTKDDPTVRRIRNISKAQGYDGWLLLNLYPLRATSPKELPEEFDYNLHIANVNQMVNFFVAHYPPKIWCAWGASIKVRYYFEDCIKKINEVARYYNATFFNAGLTKDGHPRHPLYLPSDVKLTKF